VSEKNEGCRFLVCNGFLFLKICPAIFRDPPAAILALIKNAYRTPKLLKIHKEAFQNIKNTSARKQEEVI
jgi:hypothetical protein